MTPFFELRNWLRNGPRGAQVAAGTAVLLTAVLAAWSAIPLDDDESTELVVDTPAASAPSAGASQAEGGPGPAGFADDADQTATTNAPGPTQAIAGAGGSGPPTASPSDPGSAATSGDRCSDLRATDQGVSPTEISLAVGVIDLAGEVGNETIGLRGNIEEVVHAVVAGVNSEGGAACRQLRIRTYKINPLDSNEQRAKCLEIVRDKPFAVIDIAGFVTPVSRRCLFQAQIPYQGTGIMNEDELTGGYPFLFTPGASTDRSARSWVFESAARGWFGPSNGFGKLGVLLNECNPRGNNELLQNLAKVGVPRERTSAFTIGGCGLGTPNEIGQALLQHRNDGVSHVFLGGGPSNSENYVRQADAVEWKPKYLTSDYQQETNPTLGPNWPDGFDGAIAITSLKGGERNSGIGNPWVDRCNEWLKKAKVAPSEDEQDVLPPIICDQFRSFAAAANASGANLTRGRLFSEGLPKVGRFETAVMGDGIFDRQRKVSGGDFIRAIQWHLDCTCWKVIDRDMKPAH